MEFDLSWASGVRSDCHPHLKVNLMISSNYGRSFMLSSISAQFHLILWLTRCTTRVQSKLKNRRTLVVSLSRSLVLTYETTVSQYVNISNIWFIVFEWTQAPRAQCQMVRKPKKELNDNSLFSNQKRDKVIFNSTSPCATILSIFQNVLM